MFGHRVLCLLFLFTTHFSAFAQQQTLSIEECYRLARNNYPLIKKHDLIGKSSEYSIQNASKLYLPQFSLSGQATYQSETISFSDVPGIPGIDLPTVDKDQYRIQAEVDQQLYDGGVSRNLKAAARMGREIEEQGLEVSLYTLKDRLTEIYFSILLMDEQLKQNDIRRSDLQNAAERAQAAYKNGTGYKSNVDELKAEIVHADMTATEFMANRKAYRSMLSILTGQAIGDSTILLMPDQQPAEPVIKRPELTLFDLQKKNYDIREKQLRSDYTPKVGAFIQGAYGRPTLNIIKNEFGPWFIGGVRMNWSFGSLYSLKNNKRILDIGRQTLDIDKDIFLFNTRLTLNQQNAEIEKYTRLVEQDDEAIALRSSVKQSAKAQLENGVITTHDYISQVNAENLARQSRILHHIQLLRAQYNYKNTSGN